MVYAAGGTCYISDLPHQTGAASIPVMEPNENRSLEFVPNHRTHVLYPKNQTVGAAENEIIRTIFWAGDIS